MSYFKNKSAVVTGGASGLGYSLCKALADEGAVVVVGDINLEGAEHAAERINRAGGRAAAAHLDVADPDAVSDLLKKTAADHGSLDFMVNNAGIAVGAEASDISSRLWRKAVDVNLMGVVYGSTEAYRIMAGQGHGHIVNISSLAGLIGYPTALPYATAKFGIMGLSISLRAEAFAAGVKVNVACPGFVKTRMFDDATVINAENADVIPDIPFKMMDPDHAAQLILRGVRQDRAISVFPFYARLLWWLYRINPKFVSPLANKLVQDFRAVKKVVQTDQVKDGSR